MRDLQRVDVPHAREVGDVLGVGPVAEAREVSVGAGLARVLRGRLAVHLQDAAARPAEHPPQDREVVDLARRGGRLVRLVDALEDGLQQPLGVADDLGRGADGGGVDVADPGRPLRRAGARTSLELLEADGVLAHVRLVDPAVRDQLVYERVEQGEVRAAADGEVDVGAFGDRRRPRVDAHEARRVRARKAVEHPHPQHGLRLRDVVAVQRDGVGVVDVGVGAWLAVAAERLLERLRCGRRAQARVAVDVVGADARAGDHGLRVVLLEEQLAGRVEADRARPGVVEQLARAPHHRLHRLVPAALHQLPVTADERPRSGGPASRSPASRRGPWGRAGRG